jgi:hypothetical protein
MTRDLTITETYTLVAAYDDLTIAERVDATRIAEELGADAAIDDRGAAGGFDQPAADAETYFIRIVEPAGVLAARDDLTDRQADVFAALDRDPRGHQAVAGLDDTDPRVRAFRKGWALNMRDAALDYAAVEDADLTTFVDECEAEIARLGLTRI